MNNAQKHEERQRGSGSAGWAWNSMGMQKSLNGYGKGVTPLTAKVFGYVLGLSSSLTEVTCTPSNTVKIARQIV
jgi:hypothetical protein